MTTNVVNILATLILFASKILGEEDEELLVNCYEQYCLKQDTGWVCQYSGNGRETEFMTDMYCYEDRTENDREPHRMSRMAIPPWYYDKEPQNKDNTTSTRSNRKCKYEKSSQHEYCLCNKPLCNNKFKLPGNFKVDNGLQYWVNHNSDRDAYCYHQYCVKRDFGWVCLHAGNGKQTKLLATEYCSEYRSENDKDHKYILRAVSSMHVPYDKEFMDNLENHGQACQFNKTELDFCLCNKPLCNNKFRLPDNFKVDDRLTGNPDEYKED